MKRQTSTNITAGVICLLIRVTQGALTKTRLAEESSTDSTTFTTFEDQGDWSSFPEPPQYYVQVRVAHAVLASIAWLVFFPLGGIVIRVMEVTYVVEMHSALQTCGYLIFAAAAGMGIWMARTVQVLDRYHPIIGLTLLGCLALQPITELANHFFYRKYPKTVYLGYVHLWFGRLLIIVGIIQGGLGFVFSASLPMGTAEPAPRIAYGVVATIVWILYVSLAIVWPELKHTFTWWQQRQNQMAEDGQGLRTMSLSDAGMSAPNTGSVRN